MPKCNFQLKNQRSISFIDNYDLYKIKIKKIFIW